MAEVYDDALRTLLRLQGEAVPGEQVESGPDGNALSSTLGKAERAGRAAEVVEKM
jgi:kinetochor protein Mis14/NSL1